MTQMAGVTTIAIGVVFVLLLGEIDLSIGYVSGVAGVIVAQLQIPDESWQVKGVLAIAIAVDGRRALIGGFQGSFVAFLGIPSFVVTLAGLLFWQGVILYVIGGAGRDRDRGLDDQQPRELLLLRHGGPPDRRGRERALRGSRRWRASSAARRHGIRTDNLVVVALKLAAVRRRDLRRRRSGRTASAASRSRSCS